MSMTSGPSPHATSRSRAPRRLTPAHAVPLAADGSAGPVRSGPPAPGSAIGPSAAGQRSAGTRAGRPPDPWADDVFDAGMDSFPASDPPSWSPLRVGAPAA